MKTVENCPICKESSFVDYLKVKDFMVSKECFTVVECRSCSFHFTNPIPNNSKIKDYYKSEKYISHSSSKKGVINFLYNVVRKITLKSKIKIVKHEAKGSNILDIGSGTGHFLRIASENGFNIHGVEPDERAREFAHVENGVRSVPQENLYDIARGSMDVVTMWHVLEHVYDLNKDIQKIHEILSNNGKLIVAVPNMGSYDARYYKKYWAAYDVPRHLYHFTKDDMGRLFKNHDFQLRKVIPMKFDAYYISMLSEKYRSRLFPFGFFIGALSNLKAKKYGYSSQIYIFDKT